ncbi:MAG: phosphate acyltransferase PlsX [Oscillospiraceae bacterium]|nr:phosphate acyltransferase PlsX [Oscillospiraceae bacterium]
MKIIIDAMGGDKAPGEIVKGALRAWKELGVSLLLVGKKEEIAACLNEAGCEETKGELEIVDAREVVTMEDDPSTATRRKKDSSMTVALNLLRDGKGDAVVSAGSTGALLTGATLIVKRIRGIRRAAMAPVLPAGEHGVMLIDCGANVECTAEYLLQFACMGSFYAWKLMGCEEPRVGLLNVGTEDTKGGALQHEAFALLREAGEQGRIRFIGNVEGTDVFSGKADVVVTDGFTGNVLLKGTEGVIKYIMKSLKGVFYKSLKNKLAAAVLKNDLAEMKRSMDVNEVGGTALIGIAKPVVKAHGSSDASSFFAAIRQAKAFSESGIIDMIADKVDLMKSENGHGQA